MSILKVGHERIMALLDPDTERTPHEKNVKPKSKKTLKDYVSMFGCIVFRSAYSNY
jgi:hypothetical protein